MSTCVRMTGALLVPMMALGGGCASVGPSTMTAPAGGHAHPVQTAWPGEAMRVVKASAVMGDHFEGLLVRAGVDALDQFPPRERPLDREGATRLLALLLDKPLPLRSFPPRMGACFLLREVLESGPASREELNRRVARFRQVVVLRPDGYLAWVLNGETQQRAGPGQVEFKDGVFQMNGYVLGQFYSGRWGAYRPVDAQMEPLKGSTILGEVYYDSDLFGRTMDGVEEAFFALAMAIGKFLSQPLDGIAELRHLPAGVAALIASSPEYLERFKLMTAGEQIQAVSRLSTTLLTMFAGGSAVSAGATRGLGGMEVTGLSLSARGTLALNRVVVPAGEVATVLAAGAGAPIILQSTAAPSQSAAADGMKGSSVDTARAVKVRTKQTGEFSVSDWTGYPSGIARPSGPFRLLEGVEYEAARAAANKANAALRAANPAKYAGKQIHEIHPVKFGGSPTDPANKIALTPAEHAKYTTFWNRVMRDRR